MEVRPSKSTWLREVPQYVQGTQVGQPLGVFEERKRSCWPLQRRYLPRSCPDARHGSQIFAACKEKVAPAVTFASPGFHVACADKCALGCRHLLDLLEMYTRRQSLTLPNSSTYLIYLKQLQIVVVSSESGKCMLSTLYHCHWARKCRKRSRTAPCLFSSMYIYIYDVQLSP